MKIYPQSSVGSKGAPHLNHERSMQVSPGNPVFTTTLSGMKNLFITFPDILKTTRRIGPMTGFSNKNVRSTPISRQEVRAAKDKKEVNLKYSALQQAQGNSCMHADLTDVRHIPAANDKYGDQEYFVSLKLK